ncbi:unnamed protein product [Rhizophagus irregularis]|nr:unnamed protein product [Rhizophagus irregularis]
MKPENILLSSDDKIKISDFGWAIHTPDASHRRMTFCGTPDYLAPEMIKDTGYDQKIDSWTLGVLCYEFLVGEPPSMVEDLCETYKKIAMYSISINYIDKYKNKLWLNKVNIILTSVRRARFRIGININLPGAGSIAALSNLYID